MKHLSTIFNLKLWAIFILFLTGTAQAQNCCNAGFSYQNNSNLYTFTAEQLDPNAFYFWDFGNGEYSIDPTPAPVHFAVGKYFIKLKKQNYQVNQYFDTTYSTCEKSEVIYVDSTIVTDTTDVTDTTNVNQQCLAGFTYTQNGNVVEFHSQSLNFTTTHTWKFENDSVSYFTISHESDPLHVYTKPGTYKVTHHMFIFDINIENGHVYEDSCMTVQYITVTDDIGNTNNCNLADFTYQVTGKNVSANAVTSDQQNYKFTHQWDFNEGSSSVQNSTSGNANHQYNAPGIYTIKHTIFRYIDANDGYGFKLYDSCSITKQVNVDSTTTDTTKTCDASFSSIKNAQKTYTFFPLVNTNGTHLWNFGDGSSATGTNVSHTYAQAGDYYVEHRSIQGYDTCVSIGYIVLTDTIVDCQINLNTSVVGDSLTFSFDMLPNFNYQVNFGDSSNVFNFGSAVTGTYYGKHFYADSGSYTVCVTAINLSNNQTCNACNQVQVNKIIASNNPVDTQISISAGNDVIQSVTLMNTNGVAVYTNNNVQQSNYTINTAGIANGMYYLNIYTVNGLAKTQLMYIQHN